MRDPLLRPPVRFHQLADEPAVFQRMAPRTTAELMVPEQGLGFAHLEHHGLHDVVPQLPLGSNTCVAVNEDETPSITRSHHQHRIALPFGE